MKPFDELFAKVATPRLLSVFGERNSLGDFEAVSIRLYRSQQPFDWPRVIVGDLTTRQIETNGRVEEREVITLHGPTSSLVTGTMPLPERTQVSVPKYGDSPFQPVIDECKYGDPMTTLSLIRVPLKVMDNFHEQRGA